MLLYKIHDFPLAISSWQVFQTLPKTISNITWASRAMEISGNIDKNRGKKDLSSSLWVQKTWELIIFSTSTAFFFFWERGSGDIESNIISFLFTKLSRLELYRTSPKYSNICYICLNCSFKGNGAKYKRVAHGGIYA